MTTIMQMDEWMTEGGVDIEKVLHHTATPKISMRMLTILDAVADRILTMTDDPISLVDRRLRRRPDGEITVIIQLILIPVDTVITGDTMGPGIVTHGRRITARLGRTTHHTMTDALRIVGVVTHEVGVVPVQAVLEVELMILPVQVRVVRHETGLAAVTAPLRYLRLGQLLLLLLLLRLQVVERVVQTEPSQKYVGHQIQEIGRFPLELVIRTLSISRDDDAEHGCLGRRNWINLKQP